MPVPAKKLDELQQKIGIAFRDPSLLLEALTHSSFANENPLVSPRDNERLEYLGDAVLQLITAEYLYKMRPEAKEGEMTQVRSAMVNTNTLATLSEELGIGDFLYLGKGIAKGGGRNLRSLLANAFEAVLGAIFLDAGYDAAYYYCLERFKSMPEAVQDENHKGRLQQVAQERFGVTPYYDSVGARGPGGRMREYTAVVYAGGDPLGTGHGRSKQSAEQLAAKDALEKLVGEAQASRRSRRGRRRGRVDEPAPVSDRERPPPVESVLSELEPRPEPVEAAIAAGEAAEQAPPKPRRRRSRKPAEPAAAPTAAAPPAASDAPDTPPEQPAEPTAAPEPKPQRRTRRRRAEQPAQPAQEAQPAQPAQPAREAQEDRPAEPAPPTEAAQPAPAPKPRRSRRRTTRSSDDSTVRPEEHANGIPGPSQGAPPEPAPEPAQPTRSRQLGEPLDDPPD